MQTVTCKVRVLKVIPTLFQVNIPHTYVPAPPGQVVCGCPSNGVQVCVWHSNHVKVTQPSSLTGGMFSCGHSLFFLRTARLPRPLVAHTVN
jgi:hypothetical protein